VKAVKEKGDARRPPPQGGERKSQKRKRLASDQGSVVRGFDQSKPNDPDLARVVEAWLNLPEHIRAAVLALVQAGCR